MSFKVTTLRIGKGRTIEKEGTWTKKYYEVELAIEDESEVPIAKASVEGLIDGWLTGTNVVEPQTTAPSQSQKKSYDTEKIKWEQVKGSSGPYLRSEDVNSLDFKGLLQDLQAHKGKFRKNGFFYWVFRNGSTVGRKKVK
jgi:hypothetical protein